MSGYLVGVDIGGTFTDCVVVAPSGTVVTAKAASTPPDFSGGFVAALEIAAGKLGKDLASFCREVAMVSHGTTIGGTTIAIRPAGINSSVTYTAAIASGLGRPLRFR